MAGRGISRFSTQGASADDEASLPKSRLREPLQEKSGAWEYDFDGLFERLDRSSFERPNSEEIPLIRSLLSQIRDRILSPFAMTISYAQFSTRVGAERGVIVDSSDGVVSVAMLAAIQGGGFTPFGLARYDLASAMLLDRRAQSVVSFQFMDRPDEQYFSDRKSHLPADHILFWDGGGALDYFLMDSEGEASAADLRKVIGTLQHGAVNADLTRRSIEWLNEYWNTPPDDGLDSLSL